MGAAGQKVKSRAQDGFVKPPKRLQFFGRAPVKALYAADLSRGAVRE